MVFDAKVIVRGGRQFMPTVTTKGDRTNFLSTALILANGQLSQFGWQCASVSPLCLLRETCPLFQDADR
jgi:hypothetical protein